MRTNSVFQGLGVVAFLSFTALAVACSGTSTGTGTSSSSSSGGKGIFGTTNSDGGTTSSTTSSGGSSNCAAESGDTSCATCAKTSCCTQLDACDNSADCASLFNCADPCTTDACVTQCEQQFPNGVAPAQALTNCGNTNCTAACGGTSSSSSSSSSSGSSGSSTCLSGTPQGGTECPSGYTTVDCPDGNPDASKCSANSQGLTGIYCCAP